MRTCELVVEPARAGHVGGEAVRRAGCASSSGRCPPAGRARPRWRTSSRTARWARARGPRRSRRGAARGPARPTASAETARFETAPFSGSPTVRPERDQVIGQGPTLRRSAAMHDTRQAVVRVVRGQEANVVSLGREAPRRGPRRGGRPRLDTCTSTGRRALRAPRHRRPPLRMRHTLRLWPSATSSSSPSSRSARSGAGAAPEERAQDKREFAAACAEFGEDHLLRTYSLVGTRGDCDLMVRAAGLRRSTRSTSCTCCSTRAG